MTRYATVWCASAVLVWGISASVLALNPPRILSAGLLVSDRDAMEIRGGQSCYTYAPEENAACTQKSQNFCVQNVDETACIGGCSYDCGGTISWNYDATGTLTTLKPGEDCVDDTKDTCYFDTFLDNECYCAGPPKPVICYYHAWTDNKPCGPYGHAAP